MKTQTPKAAPIGKAQYTQGAIVPRVLNETEEMRKRVSMWNQRFTLAQSHQQPMHQKWAKWYDDMYAHFQSTAIAPWRSKVYLPIIAAKVWDLIARFVQYKPGWEVTVRNVPTALEQGEFNEQMQALEAKVDKVKDKMEFDYDNPLMEEPMQDKFMSVMMDASVAGTGVARVPYKKKKSIYKQHPLRGENIDIENEEVTEKNEGYNDFEPINIFNFFITPSAKSIQQAPWIIIRDYVPFYQLDKEKLVTDDKGNKTGMYVNLDAIRGGKSATDASSQFSASRNRLVTQQDTIAVDGTVQMVETFECWDEETCEQLIYAATGNTSPGQQWVEIYRSGNIYWHLKKPFVKFAVRNKPYQFWGESLFENSETLQAAYNDIFNHYMDSLNMADGMVAIEEGSSVEPFVVEPGGEFHYRGEMPKQFRFNEPNPAQLQTTLNVLDGVVERATISQYASGIPNSDTDTTQGTATGITRLMEAAAEKVGMMRSNFRRSVREVGYMWLSNSQQFTDYPVVVSKKQRNKVVPSVLKPADLQGIHCDLRVDDSSFEPVSKDQKRKDYLEWVTNLLAWQTASVTQATQSGQPTDAVRIDFNQIINRASEMYSENSSHYVLPNVAAAAVMDDARPMSDPTTPNPDKTDEQVAQEVATGDLISRALESPEMDLNQLVEQSDGKRMPRSFPRTVNTMGEVL